MLAAGFPYMVCCGIVQYVNMFGTGIGCVQMCVSCTAQGLPPLSFGLGRS